jgi:lipopolysaccharide heptosyltransferase III
VDRPVVLVFRTGHLGDTLASLPAIRAIRAAHADARLVLLTDRNSVKESAVTSWDVVGRLGLFAEVRFLPVPFAPSDLITAAREVRALKPWRLYYLPPLPRTRAQAARDWLFFRVACSIRSIVGLRSTGGYPVRDADGALVRIAPERERLLHWIAPAVGSAAEKARADATPGDADRGHAHTMLEAAGFSSSTLIAICAGSKVQATRWPEERFEAMGSVLLRDRPDVRLVLLGSAAERQLGDRLRAAWGDRALNLAGLLTIWQSAAVLERSALYIGNDTGTMHLAACVGTPCVAIFSARDNPGKWEPYGANHAVLRRDVPCAGCALDTCIDHDLECLKAISVNDVLTVVKARLNAQRYQHA